MREPAEPVFARVVADRWLVFHLGIVGQEAMGRLAPAYRGFIVERPDEAKPAYQSVKGRRSSGPAPRRSAHPPLGGTGRRPATSLTSWTRGRGAISAWSTASDVPDPSCDCCPNTFSSREAEGDLKRYREKGPDRTTRALIDALIAEGVDGATLLDIGGGIGAIQLELLAAGAAKAESVEASEAYVDVARAEAERRGYAARTTAHVGDFVALARDIERADVVTLDRVVCCYPDLPAFLEAASDHARRVVGLVYPRDVWWNRVAARAIAAFGWLTRDATRWYLHRPGEVDDILRAAGYRRREITRDMIWQVALYERTGATHG